GGHHLLPVRRPDASAVSAVDPLAVGVEALKGNPGAPVVGAVQVGGLRVAGDGVDAPGLSREGHAGELVVVGVGAGVLQALLAAAGLAGVVAGGIGQPRGVIVFE